MTEPAPPAGRLRLRRPLTMVWRAEGVLQLGVDAGGVVFEGVPRSAADVIAALREPRTLPELVYLTPDLPPQWSAWLVGRLEAAGLLVADPPAARLGLVGSGPLADATAGLLRMAGVGELERIAYGRVRPRSPRLADTTLTPLPHWSLLPEGWPDLTIVATDTHEPDRALTDALLRAGRSHLIVRVEADRAVVGPLVLPGTTPCVRCQDLVRCRCDPAWPLLVAQLCRERRAPDPVLQAWAVATVVAQAGCHLAGGDADVIGRTLELSAADHVLRAREWPMHPDCGCGLAVA